MEEWDLMSEMAKASNQGDQVTLSELILNNDLEGQAITMAISEFKLTPKNIELHIEAANKLANLTSPETLRESKRQAMLIGLLAAKKSPSTTWE